MMCDHKRDMPYGGWYWILKSLYHVGPLWRMECDYCQQRLCFLGYPKDGYMPRVLKPWGHYVDHFRSPQCVFKILTVNPGCRLSLQSHAKRNEDWYVLSGAGIAEIDGSRYEIAAESKFEIHENQIHRLDNTGDIPLIVAEMQTGDCDENDIVRISDDYGRAGS